LKFKCLRLSCLYDESSDRARNDNTRGAVLQKWFYTEMKRSDWSDHENVGAVAGVTIVVKIQGG